MSGFDEVELGGVGTLSVRQTGTESLSVEAEEGVLPKIRTEVVDGRLLIGPEPNTGIETTEPIDYELTVDNLRALELSGSGDVDASEELDAKVGGAGSVEYVGDPAVEQDVSGVGRVSKH